METIFDALRESHQTQRSLIRKLRLSNPGAKRQEIFTELRIELASHEAAEERFLYCEILMDDRGLHASRDALADHHKMDEIVERLQTRDHRGRGWMRTVEGLANELHDHLREEEKIFFQLSGKILNATKKISLAKKYRKNFEKMKKKLTDSLS